MSVPDAPGRELLTGGLSAFRGEVGPAGGVEGGGAGELDAAAAAERLAQGGLGGLDPQPVRVLDGPHAPLGQQAGQRRSAGRATLGVAQQPGPRQRRVGIGDPVRPDSRYGVSKAFGEAIGALYAYKHGLRVACLRIGNFGDTPVDVRRLSIWLKPEDLVQLIRIGLEHPDLRY